MPAFGAIADHYGLHMAMTLLALVPALGFIISLTLHEPRNRFASDCRATVVPARTGPDLFLPMAVGWLRPSPASLSTQRPSRRSWISFATSEGSAAPASASGRRSYRRGSHIVWDSPHTSLRLRRGRWCSSYARNSRTSGAFYSSAENYTTLGYGDVIMSPAWRLLGPLEQPTAC